MAASAALQRAPFRIVPAMNGVHSHVVDKGEAIMNWKKIAIVAATGLSFAIGAASGASADTRWERHHPRRDEVVDRLQHQNARIRDERSDGELSAWQAHRLHAQDRAIFHQEQFAARLNHGHITKAEKRALNQEENQVGRRIGR
jgi:hypothetical protein